MKMLNIKPRDLESKTYEMRNQGLIPGVLYGPSIQSRAVFGTNIDMERAIFNQGEVFQIPIKGKNKVMVKFGEVQRDPVTKSLLHFSLVQLPEGEECTVDVPVNFKGTPHGVKKGGVFVVLKDEIQIAGKPKKIPDMINANVSQMEIGQKLTVKDIKTPRYIDTAEEESQVIAFCRPPMKELPLIAESSVSDPIQDGNEMGLNLEKFAT